MSIKIAINGFGRIGRLALRRVLETKEFEVVAINDLSSAENLAYLLKYDTAQGPLVGHTVSYEGNSIVLDGRKIEVIGQKDPNLIDWSKYGAELVLECTGRFKGKKDAGVHITAGHAKGVVISAPADEETPTVVYGVNEKIISKDEPVISGASCTTNCLAPIAKVLEDSFGIESGMMLTVHAYTNDQTTLDLVKEKDFRRGRAAASNIVPNSTGAAKAIHLVIPSLKGKFQGSAARVPVIDGSLVVLNVILKKEVTKEEIAAAMKQASEGSLKGVLGYTEDKIVSSDILGSTYGSIFDATQTIISKDSTGKQAIVSVAAWYDNEYSYTCQFIRSAVVLAKKLGLK